MCLCVWVWVCAGMCVHMCTHLINTICIRRTQQYVSLMTAGDNGKDVISELLEEGLLRVEKNRRCSSKLVSVIKCCYKNM